MGKYKIDGNQTTNQWFIPDIRNRAIRELNLQEPSLFRITLKNLLKPPSKKRSLINPHLFFHHVLHISHSISWNYSTSKPQTSKIQVSYGLFSKISRNGSSCGSLSPHVASAGQAGAGSLGSGISESDTWLDSYATLKLDLHTYIILHRHWNYIDVYVRFKFRGTYDVHG